MNDPDPDAAALQNVFRLSVVLEKRLQSVRGWRIPQWDLAAILPTDAAVGQSPVVVHREAELTRTLWPGLKLELFRDGCEGYWYNLTSGHPVLFVICDIDESDGEAIPLLITASHDDAVAHMETDALVLSAPVPENIYPHIERYVVTQYVPARRKKRRRQDWSKVGGG